MNLSLQTQVCKSVLKILMEFLFPRRRKKSSCPSVWHPTLSSRLISRSPEVFRVFRHWGWPIWFLSQAVSWPGCIRWGLAYLSMALHVILSKRHFPVLWLPLLNYATFGAWNHSADSQPGWSTGVWVGLSNRAKKTFSSLRPRLPQNPTREKSPGSLCPLTHSPCCPPHLLVCHFP